MPDLKTLYTVLIHNLIRWEQKNINSIKFIAIESRGIQPNITQFDEITDVTVVSYFVDYHLRTYYVFESVDFCHFPLTHFRTQYLTCLNNA
jgi:hypothetical protein